MKSKYKKTIWPLVFIISIGGFYFPKIGLLMFPMLVAIMIFGFLKNRYWCGNICPRGAFFDTLLKHFSIGNKIPNIFRNNFLQIFALVALMSMFILNTIKAFNYWGSSVFLDKLGMVGVIMCAITTFVGLILGLFVHQRTWCSFCPMGTVQRTLYRTKKSMMLILLFTSFFTASNISAYELKASEDTFVNLSLLMQPWMNIEKNNSPDGNNSTPEFYIKTIRILMGGRITKGFNFFYGTIQTNLGYKGNFNSPISTGDAWVEYDNSREFKVDLGLLMIPFMHNFRQSSVSIHTLTFHSSLLKYPTGSDNTFSRDTGVGFRGIVLNDKISYYQHFTKGRWVGNGDLRSTTRIVYNFLDPEEDFFLAGTYLGQKSILSAGVSVDLQGGAGLNPSGAKATYAAFGTDLMLDLPLGENGLTSQVGLLSYKDSVKQNTDGTYSSVNGTGVLFEAGYRFSKLEPLIGFDWFRPRNGSSFHDQMFNTMLGFNYWFKGHNLNLKAQYALNKSEGKYMSGAISQFVIQLQGYFN